MYIVVNSDLNMSIGKTAAQVGHAVQKVMMKCWVDGDDVFWLWNDNSSAKIVLGAKNFEFDNLLKKLQEDDVAFESIIDEGRTEIPKSSMTCFAIWPYNKEDVKQYFQHLKLLK